MHCLLASVALAYGILGSAVALAQGVPMPQGLPAPQGIPMGQGIPMDQGLPMHPGQSSPPPPLHDTLDMHNAVPIADMNIFGAQLPAGAHCFTGQPTPMIDMESGQMMMLMDITTHCTAPPQQTLSPRLRSEPTSSSTAATPPTSPRTGKDLGDLLRRSDAPAADLAIGFLNGVLMASRKCAFPERITNQQIREAIIGYLASHTEAQAENGASVVVTALSEAWPCSNK